MGKDRKRLEARSGYLERRQVAHDQNAEIKPNDRPGTPRGWRANLRGTAPHHCSRLIWLPVVRDFDAADACEEVIGDVARHLVSKRSERPVVVGASDGNAKIPSVNPRTSLGANDDVQFCLVDRPIAER